MKLIFAGTPEFAAAALHGLAEAGHDIALVLTQPDRPAGRGMKLKPSAVKMVAQQLGLRVEQPISLRQEKVQALLRDVQADVMVVAAYGLILPQAVLSIPRRGCLNIHASLLPRWRGAAPIQRALLAGDTYTGITIMQMDAGLDTGDQLLSVAVAITPEDTAASLHDKLALAGTKAIVAALAQLDQLPPIKQPEAGACYAAKITKEEAQLNWQQTASEIARAVRAYNPVPGAYTWLNGNVLKVWQAVALEGQATPGQIVRADANGIVVGTQEGLLCIQLLQLAGGRRLEAPAFIAGHGSLLTGRLLGEYN